MKINFLVQAFCLLGWLALSACSPRDDAPTNRSRAVSPSTRPESEQESVQSVQVGTQVLVGDVEVLRWEDVYAAGDIDTAWAIACDHGDLDRIDRLLTEGFDPDSLIGTGDYRQPALLMAAWNGYEDVVARLLDAGANPMAREVYSPDTGFYKPGQGDTALHKAAQQGHQGIVTQLLRAGIPADVEGIQDYTPLAGAAGDLPTFRLLLEAGAQVDRAGGLDRLFASAISRSSVDMASYLLARGADLEGEASNRESGYTPLWSAAVKGDEDLVLFLLSHGANAQVRPGGKDLLELVEEQGHDSVAQLVARARAGESLRGEVESFDD